MAQLVKNSPAMQATEEMRVPSQVGKIPWRRAWQPTPVFLPGKSHRQRSLAGYSPWGGKESDMTEATEHTRVHTHAHTRTGVGGAEEDHSGKVNFRLKGNLASK